LVINRFSGEGIDLQQGAANTTIQGNFIGTNVTGTSALGNLAAGIGVGSSNNTIGGTTPAARNIVSANGSGNSGGGIGINGTGNSVQGNFIGTDASGTVALGNVINGGLFIAAGGANNTIGGTAAGARNLISGNIGNGVLMSDTSNNRILGNYIGTNVNGTAALPNTLAGIAFNDFAFGSLDNVIGGTSVGARNIISGNLGSGVEMIGESINNQVQGNYIGTDASGSSALANAVDGVRLASSQSGGPQAIIGGAPAARNVISGNGQRGIEITGDTNFNQVQSNFIGTNANGTGALPNALSGILISGGASNNTIGGTTLGNVIAFNGDRGIRIGGNTSVNNSILDNSIFSNNSLGIELGTDGVTPNDADDSDTGPNDLQNFPILSTAVTNGSTTTINGALDSTANTPFTIQFFASTSCDPSGNGEGQTFVGSISKSTGGGGHVNLGPALVSGIVPGSFVTATATIAAQNKSTSEFSPCVQVTGSFASTLQFSTGSYNPSEGIGFETLTVNRTGDTSGTVTVDFSTSDLTAEQRTDYTITSGTLSFGPGEASKTLPLLIVDDNYVEGSESLRVTLSNPTGGAVIGSLTAADVTIVDNDSNPPTTNPLDTARFFVQQHYYDFLSRYPDVGGWDFWTGQITQCGSDPVCLRAKRIDVSNSFFYELEYQQTGAYVFRFYRAAFGNHQPFPNPDGANPIESRKLPAYAVFAADRARVVGGANLAQGQQNLANAFVLRNEFLTKYPASQDGPTFVDAVLATINNDMGVNLTSQRTALINLFNAGGRGAVMYRLADDNVQTNPINNRAFIDEEYNRAFVATEYFGYLRRDADIGGFLFWLGQVNSGPLRDTTKQHAMVCSFITSAEYQQRFSSVVTHTNSECQ
jgi:hypothetical protein